jgi:hypothetical protein
MKRRTWEPQAERRLQEAEMRVPELERQGLRSRQGAALPTP